jgi:hypothetical protein
MQSNDDKAFLAVFIIVYGMFFLFAIALAIFLLICKYKIFVKAGQEGWKAIIPYYGTYVLTCEIAGKDALTFVLHLFPFVNIYARVITGLALAKSFGKEDGFGVGIGLLPVVFFPWLAFSKTIEYIGPGGATKKDSTNSLTQDWQQPDKP